MDGVGAAARGLRCVACDGARAVRALSHAARAPVYGLPYTGRSKEELAADLATKRGGAGDGDGAAAAAAAVGAADPSVANYARYTVNDLRDELARRALPPLDSRGAMVRLLRGAERGAATAAGSIAAQAMGSRSTPDEQFSAIGVLTGGGDAPGLNAVIRAVVKRARTRDGLVGLEDSFDGLIYPGQVAPAHAEDVTGILRLGGTILGTVNRGDPFADPIVTPTAPSTTPTRARDVSRRSRSTRWSASGATARSRSPTSSTRRASRSSACRRRSTTTSTARPAASGSTRP